MGAAELSRLDEIANELEAQAPMPAEFILPGATPASGALDLARAVVRRAERRLLPFAEPHPGAVVYLNRLSLVLFILGRYEEVRAGVATKTAKRG